MSVVAQGLGRVPLTTSRLVVGRVDALIQEQQATVRIPDVVPDTLVPALDVEYQAPPDTTVKVVRYKKINVESAVNIIELEF